MQLDLLTELQITFVHEFGFNSKVIVLMPGLSSTIENGPTTICWI